MNKSAFIGLIKSPNSISDTDIKSLEELVDNFPYCQIGHQFIAKAHQDNQSSLSSDKLKKAAMHSSSRKVLRNLIHSQPELITPVDTSIVEKEIESKISLKTEKVTVADPLTKLADPSNKKESSVSIEETVAKSLESTNESIVEKGSTVEKTNLETPKEQTSQKDNKVSTPQQIDNESIEEAQPLEELKTIITPSTATPSKLPEVSKDLSPWQLYKLQEEKEKAEKQALPTPSTDDNKKVSISQKDSSINPTIKETIVADVKVETNIIESESKETLLEASPATNLDLERAEKEEISIDSTIEVIPAERNDDEVDELTTFRSDQLEKIKGDLEDITSFQKTDETEESTLDQNPIELKTSISKPATSSGTNLPEFEQKSNFDYLSELSNIKLDNLIPSRLADNQETIEEKISGSESVESNLIPDVLSTVFGIYDSKFGEALYSSEVLESDQNEELIAPQTIPISEIDQKEIIDGFLKTNPKIRSLKDLPKLQETEDLSKARSSKFGRPVTETMANIYLAQGNIKKAQGIFEKLILQFPEKKAYFAKKLREINE